MFFNDLKGKGRIKKRKYNATSKILPLKKRFCAVASLLQTECSCVHQPH